MKAIFINDKKGKKGDAEWPVTIYDFNKGWMNLMTTKQVCKHLKITVSTLKQFRLRGVLPYYKLGGIIFYPSVEVAKLYWKKEIQFDPIASPSKYFLKHGSK